MQCSGRAMRGRPQAISCASLQIAITTGVEEIDLELNIKIPAQDDLQVGHASSTWTREYVSAVIHTMMMLGEYPKSTTISHAARWRSRPQLCLKSGRDGVMRGVRLLNVVCSLVKTIMQAPSQMAMREGEWNGSRWSKEHGLTGRDAVSASE